MFLTIVAVLAGYALMAALTRYLDIRWFPAIPFGELFFYSVLWPRGLLRTGRIYPQAGSRGSSDPAPALNLATRGLRRGPWWGCSPLYRFLP